MINDGQALFYDRETASPRGFGSIEAAHECTWNFRLEPQGFSTLRMSECKDMGMQTHPPDGIAAGTIFFIPHDGMTEFLHVNTNLIFTSRLQIDFQ